MKPTNKNAFGSHRSRSRWSTKAAFLWIGGVCFMAGSLAVGVTGLASAAPGPTTLVNQGAAGTSAWPVSVSNFPAFPTGFSVNNTSAHPVPVTGTVGIDSNANGVSVPNGVALNAGTNDIGTVHVAGPHLIGAVSCTVPDASEGCQSGATVTSGTLIQTVGVYCTIANTHRLQVAVFNSFTGTTPLPLTFTYTDFAGNDHYATTVTNLDFPFDGNANIIHVEVGEDYTASSGNGANCTFSYIGDQP
jgi:hypothetical protein